MARPKKTEIATDDRDDDRYDSESEVESVSSKWVGPVSPIKVTFANGDDNLLRDKINEIVERING